VRVDDGQGTPTGRVARAIGRRTLLTAIPSTSVAVGLTGLLLPTAAAASSPDLTPAQDPEALVAELIISGRPTSDASGTLVARRVSDGTVPESPAQGRIGDPPITVPIGALAADATWLYFGQIASNAAGRRIGRVTPSGTQAHLDFIELNTGGPDGYAPANPCAIAVSTTHLYWTELLRSTIGRVRLDATGFEPTWQQSLPHRAEALALSPTHLFFAEYANGLSGDFVQGVSRLDLATGAVSLLLTRSGAGAQGVPLAPGAGSAAPVALAASTEHLYVATARSDDLAESTGWIARCAHDGTGFQADWARNTASGTAVSNRRIACDDVFLYATAGERIVRFPLSSSEPTISTLVTSGMSDGGLALAPTSPPVTPPD